MHENIKKKKGRWESFDDSDGLGNICRRLLEDRRGNIWIGTENGLSRYDGKKFVNFTKTDGLAGNSVSRIHQDKEGNIWVGTDSGLSRYDGVKFVNFTEQNGLPDKRVNAICQDKEGNIWVGTWNGLSRYDGKSFINFSQKEDLAINSVVLYLLQDREGNIWVGTLENGLSRYDGKSFANFSQKDGLADKRVNSICQDKAGNIWVGTDSGLSRYDGKSFVNFTQKEGLAGNVVCYIYPDKEGNIWVGTWESGASCYDGNEFVNFNTDDGLAGNRILNIMQDREGSLWFACLYGGISRYNPYEISPISDEVVNEVMMQDKSGKLWWGFENILSEFNGKEINHYFFKNAIYELFEDSRGQLWIGTHGGGLFIYDNIKDLSRIGQGKPGPNITRNLTVNDGLAHNEVWRIREDIDGNVWIGTFGGLSRYDGKNFINFTADDGLGSDRSDPVSVIYQDSQGSIWFAGTFGGGISRYDGKKFHKYTTDDELVNDRVVCIIEDDKNNLWIGTHAGISCYDGKSFKNYTTSDGLLGNFAQRLFQDRRKQLWIATLGGGISRFDGKNFQALTTEDGLPSNSVTGIIEDADGSMIISTYRGIIRYVPDYQTPPVIQIDEVDADKIYEQPKNIQISKSASLIRIRYHGIGFKAKRMRYNYILEGYDKDWKATWDKEVHYENLPIGEYTFKVVAINRDLVYSEKAAELKLTVQPDPREATIITLQTEVDRLRHEVGRKYHFENIVGRSAPMKQMYILMEKAIDSGLTVLISGETGTGKELAAKAIHYTAHVKTIRS